MKLRTLLLSVAILAVLSAAAFFLTRTPAPVSTDPRLNHSLVDAATLEQAAKLRLSDAGKTVLLTRQPDATWRVTSYFDLPADFSKLSRFTGDLADAKLQRLVTTSPTRIARLEFKDTKIELLDSSDKPLTSLTLGKTADTGGRYLRFGTEDKAYLASLNAWLDADSKNWADAQLLSVKSDDVAKIEFPTDSTSTSAAPLTFTREKKDSPWTASPTPANEKLKTDKVTSLLSSLTGLRFSDTTQPTDPKATEARQHPRTFKLTTFDKKTYTVTLARKPEEKKLKPPAPTTDGKTGPAALGTTADLAKTAAAPADNNAEPKTQNPKPAAPLAPEFETIPAGPVFVQISSSDASAPINAEMQKRAFEVSDYVFTGLPQTTAEFFEPAPPPPVPAAAPAPQPAAPAKP